MRRQCIAAIPLALLALLLAAAPAGAARTWCRVDPTFNVNGRSVHVYLSSYTDMYASATGPTRVTLTVPSGSSAQLLGSDAGFGYGYTVKIEYSDKLRATDKTIQIQVSVYAPAKDGSLPVKVDIDWTGSGLITPPAGVSGSRTKSGFANRWVDASLPIK